MNPRDNALDAINHKQPHHVPVSIGSTIVDGLTKYAKAAYEQHCGVPAAGEEITHIAMQTVATPEWIKNDIGMPFETIRMKGPFLDNTRFEADGSYTDEFGIYWKKCELYNDPVRGPLFGSITEDDIRKNPWADASDKGRVRGLRDEALAIRARGDKVVVADIMCGGPFEQSLWMRGWDDFLCDMCVDKKLAEALLDRITENDIALWDAYLTEVGDLVDIVCQGDDLGMQDRSIISAELYREMVFKYHKRLYDFIKSKTKAKIFMHSCGSVYDLLPDLIEAGVDILNPVQIAAKNMEPEKLKSDFGDALCFWGGIDTQYVLPHGSRQEIKDLVKRLVDVLGKDGGYVLAPGHNIQNYVEPWRIQAMIGAMKKSQL